MQILPQDIQLAGDELAVLWNDGEETYIGLERLRRACPCAGCCGEPDALGHVDKPHVSYDPARSFRLQSYGIVGGYAFQLTWGDGHSTGLYSFALLRQLGQAGHPSPTPA